MVFEHIMQRSEKQQGTKYRAFQKEAASLRIFVDFVLSHTKDNNKGYGGIRKK